MKQNKKVLTVKVLRELTHAPESEGETHREINSWEKLVQCTLVHWEAAID